MLCVDGPLRSTSIITNDPMTPFETKACPHTNSLSAVDLRTLQVNVTLRCNQECRHCHLACSPARPESMDWATMQLVKAAARQAQVPLIDITGGAPELHPHIRPFIHAMRSVAITVQMRTNLTALLEPQATDLIGFLRDHDVKLVASMPCYLEENVRAQRGPTVYQRSIEVIRRLNAAGYGADGGPELDLVYNPNGPFLPPNQAELEEDYRRELAERFDIHFSRLLTLTNVPVGRFGQELRDDGAEADYFDLLEDSFNAQTIDALMCRHQISVGWDGRLYDCDFNLALGLPLDGPAGHISRFDPDALASRRIVTGRHCFGCTAGAGSSCGGALAE